MGSRRGVFPPLVAVCRENALAATSFIAPQRADSTEPPSCCRSRERNGVTPRCSSPHCAACRETTLAAANFVAPKRPDLTELPILLPKRGTWWRHRPPWRGTLGAAKRTHTPPRGAAGRPTSPYAPCLHRHLHGDIGGSFDVRHRQAPHETRLSTAQRVFGPRVRHHPSRRSATGPTWGLRGTAFVESQGRRLGLRYRSCAIRPLIVPPPLKTRGVRS